MSVQCINLRKEFSSKQKDILAVQNINFAVSEREFVSVVGPSGCGKSTLLRLIGGLIEPTSGEVVFNATSSKRTYAHQTVTVFQEQGLFPWMNVLDNVAFGLETQKVGKADRVLRAKEIIQKIGLSEFLNYYPHELSGGMRQRVALARAFLADPEILLMDEPFRALDSQTKLILQEELLRIWSEEQKTVIFITHDIEEALLLSDRILLMSGRPGTIIDVIDIPLERPRDHSLLLRPEIVEKKWQIWKTLEKEVRRDQNLI